MPDIIAAAGWAGGGDGCCIHVCVCVMNTNSLHYNTF